MPAPYPESVSHRDPVVAFVGLGANLGDAAHTLQAALEALQSMPGVFVRRVSGFYRTAPLEASGPDYTNAVAQLDTVLTAPALLAVLQAVEQRFGRQRPFKNAPRTLDLDVLLYGSARIESPHLVVPHPRMWQRAFVLHPLAELAPHAVPPGALLAVAAQRVVRCAALENSA